MSARSTDRIVVTGTGIVGPLGCSTEIVWSRLLAGNSGIRTLPADVSDSTGTTVGGRVPTLDEDSQGGYDPERVIAAKERKKMDRFIEFALVAAHEALAQAGWQAVDEHQKQRTATIIASGVGGFDVIAEAVRTTDQRGPRRLSPFTAPSFLANMAAANVSIANGFKGPLGAPITACAAGVHAIGDAARLIRSGEADIAVCGGTEAAIHRTTLGCFAAARALSTGFNDRPHEASRPFDRDRDGFVMAEGAGLLVIESLGHALARGAQPLAELVGYGTSADAYHLTAGLEDGSGARRAMEQALKQAGVTPEDVQHINAHATSLPKSETAANWLPFDPSSELDRALRSHRPNQARATCWAPQAESRPSSQFCRCVIRSCRPLSICGIRMRQQKDSTWLPWRRERHQSNMPCRMDSVLEA